MSIKTVYVDGACKPNPGIGAWAWTLLDGEYDHGIKRYTTNNEMELTAPIRAIESLWKKDGKLLIVSDSQYVVLGITEWVHGWVKNNWKTKTDKPVKNLELWQELYSLVRYRWIKFQWVKGHSGNPGNEQADQLANCLIGR